MPTTRLSIALLAVAAYYVACTAAVPAWTIQHITHNNVYNSISMCSSTLGFVAAEGGKVYCTTNGVNWEICLQAGPAYYWGGVGCSSSEDVVVGGTMTGSSTGAVLAFSTDTGSSWSTPTSFNSLSGVGAIEFNSDGSGALVSEGTSSALYVTNNGGMTVSDWTSVSTTQAPTGYAFSYAQSSSSSSSCCDIAFATADGYCTASNNGAGGVTCETPWANQKTVEVVDSTTYVGGGSVEAPASGWIASSTGSGWTTQLNTTYPIFDIEMLNSTFGFAVGGNYFTGDGGIYSTTDGGSTWSLDLTTGVQLVSVDAATLSSGGMQVWAAGGNSSLSLIYTTTLA